MADNPYKGGYKFSNGIPMRDEFHDTIEKFYKYAKAQGCTQTKKELYAKLEKTIMKAAGIKA